MAPMSVQTVVVVGPSVSVGSAQAGGTSATIAQARSSIRHGPGVCPSYFLFMVLSGFAQLSMAAREHVEGFQVSDGAFKRLHGPERL